MAYLECVNTASTAGASVEGGGSSGEGCPCPPTRRWPPRRSSPWSWRAGARQRPPPAGKTEALSVDVKLVADIYGAADDETPVSREPVQPKENERVLVKLRVPSGYRNDTLEI